MEALALIPALGKFKQAEFKANLVYIVSLKTAMATKKRRCPPKQKPTKFFHVFIKLILSYLEMVYLLPCISTSVTVIS